MIRSLKKELRKLAKKKEKRDRYDPQTPYEHVKLIRESTESEISHRLECCICNEVETDEGKTPTEFARSIYKDGWRFGTSQKFCMTGPMCKKCFITPDADRGEDW
jgi:hypothetical protein